MKSGIFTGFQRELFVFLLLICVGCSAQVPPPTTVTPEQLQRMESQVRAHYNVPASVQVNISPLRTSEFPNYDALTIAFQGSDKKQSFDFLLSKDRNTLIRMSKIDLNKDAYAEVMNKIDVKGRPTRGNKDAKVVLVNYDDFECPYCSRMHQTMFPELFKEYGDRVLFIYKDYPLAEIHPWATHAAVDANCLASLNNDAYWDFADYMHANQRELNSDHGLASQFAAIDKISIEQGKRHGVDEAKLEACMREQNEAPVKASVKEGDSIGVSATPTLFVNGQELEGAVPVSEVRAALDRALKQAGVTSPSSPAADSATPNHAPTQ